jgi:ankyrin repeat protein
MKADNSNSRRNFIKLSSLIGSGVMYSTIWAHGQQHLNCDLDSDLDRFFQACKKGELQEVKNLISDNISLLQAKDDFGRSGFSIALLNNHIEIGAYLKTLGYSTDLHESILDKDWDRYNELYGEENEESTKLINQIHPIGGTGMWAAAAGGAGQDIWRVYAGNCNPNIQANLFNSSSPLQKALEYSDLKIAEITAAALLSNNTNPNPAVNRSLPPLHIAAQRGSTELVEMLIRLGAEIERKDHMGRTAIQLAEYFGQKETYDLLENHRNIHRTCSTSRYAYDINGEKYNCPDMSKIPVYLQGNLVGRAHRDLDMVKKLIGKNPQLVHALATTSEGAVEAGAHMGRQDIVEFLLESGAPYSMPTAVFMQDFSTVKQLLVEDSKRIHERGAHDFGLLWYSVIGNGNLEMAQLLIEHGANVDDQHFLGTTALHWACFRGEIELVELFVENGANVNRIGRKFTSKGESPLQSSKDDKIIDYLKSKGAK